MKRKVAFWGGTFDPLHYGHINLAQAVLDSGRSDLVLFVPAFAPPHKEQGKVSPYQDRLNMLRLALDGRDNMLVSEAEKELGAMPSYTFPVMEYLERCYPGDRLQLLVGGDSLAYLHCWYRGMEIPERWEVLTCPRPGSVLPDRDFLRQFWTEEMADRLLAGVLDTPFFEISSTDIRKKVEKGENTANIIPGKIMNYIKDRGLYRK